MQWEISFKSYQPATSKMLALPTIQLPRSWQRSMKSSKSIRNSQGKVEKIKEDGLDSIPSSSVKIRIIWGKVIVAQTWQFFDKLPEITDFGLLQQSQNRARFWICSVFTCGIANVKIDQALSFGKLKKVFSQSFLKIEWVSVPLLRLKVGTFV